MRQSQSAVLLLGALLLKPAVGTCQGIVGFELEMGGPVHHKYACIFVGTVTANGKPCPGAHVMADLAGARGEAVTEYADADAGGRFQLRVILDGKPQDETLWKLTAKAAVIGAEASEVDGRVILPEESTVMIDRSITLDGHGV